MLLGLVTVLSFTGSKVRKYIIWKKDAPNSGLMGLYKSYITMAV